MVKEMMNMIKEFNEFLEKECHCSRDNSYLLAVSGGIDSVVMVWLFHRSGIPFSIAHCNFHLRGKESDEDEHFVHELANRLQVELHIKHFKTKEYSKSAGISIQMAARNLRYEWFEEFRKENNISYVAIGHNRDDIVETFLINLSRGTGIKGLTGIKPRQGSVVRPLLFASRKDIEAYAEDQAIHWRDDSSNADTRYYRNKIRHILIPEFEKAFPAFRQNIMTTISHLREIEQLFNLTMQDIRQKVYISLPDKQLIDIEKLLKYPASETILFELLREYGVNQSMTQTLVNSLEGEPGRKIITGTHSVTRDRNFLIVTRNVPSVDREIIVDQDTTAINLPIRMKFSKLTGRNFVIPVDKNIAALDLDLITFPLTVRHWRPGDAFKPLGMRGSKKISDYLIDQKIPLPDKQHIHVIESDGNIIWLISHRIDDRYKITVATKNILLIETGEEYDQ
ncbi:MAG: tRNA lysidine(34) synthetase TilS [Bacteroidales bacterium]|nr:tRNA lysidine(34) synthetase TilS [Bacteroidales bacterium]